MGSCQGGEAGGLPFHSHTDSWLELLAGSKRWWTAQHGNTTSLAYDITLPQQAWVDNVLGGQPNAKPPAGVCSFTQYPGDVVSSPHGRKWSWCRPRMRGEDTNHTEMPYCLITTGM